MNLITATVTAIALTLAPFSGAIAQSLNLPLTANATCSFSVDRRDGSEPLVSAGEACLAVTPFQGNVRVYLKSLTASWNDRQELAPTSLFVSTDAFPSGVLTTDARARTSDGVHCAIGDMNSTLKIGVCFMINPAPVPSVPSP